MRNEQDPIENPSVLQPRLEPDVTCDVVEAREPVAIEPGVEEAQRMLAVRK